MDVDGKILREFDINVQSVLTLTFAKNVKIQLLMRILSLKSELLNKLLLKLLLLLKIKKIILKLMDSKFLLKLDLKIFSIEEWVSFLLWLDSSSNNSNNNNSKDVIKEVIFLEICSKTWEVKDVVISRDANLIQGVIS